MMRTLDAPISPQPHHTLNREINNSSPLSREIQKTELSSTIQQNKSSKVNLAQRYASSVKQRYPNSVASFNSKLALNKEAPSINHYNASQQEQNRVACYQNTQSDRLSIPKLNSSNSQTKLKEYLMKNPVQESSTQL